MGAWVKREEGWKCGGMVGVMKGQDKLHSLNLAVLSFAPNFVAFSTHLCTLQRQVYPFIFGHLIHYFFIYFISLVVTLMLNV